MQAEGTGAAARALVRGPAPVVLLVAAAAVAGVLVPGMKDLSVYQHAGRALLDGRPLYGVRDPVTGLPFTYPPAGALVMTPLAVLPTRVLDASWTAASVAALALTIALVRRGLGRSSPGWLVASLTVGALALEPVWQDLAFGQVNLLLMTAVIADLLGRDRRWSGVPVGVTAAVKLTPLVFVVVLLLVGRRPAALRATATFAASIVVGLLVAPASSAAYWDERLVRASRVGPPELAHNQSLYGLLTRVVGEPAPTWMWLLVAMPACVGVVLVAARCWRRGDPVLGACLAAIAMLLASPVSWSHHWVWAVPTALVLGERSRVVCAAWTAVFVTRPFLWPPWGHGREYSWTAADHLVGNAYVLSALALTAWAARQSSRRAVAVKVDAIRPGREDGRVPKNQPPPVEVATQQRVQDLTRLRRVRDRMDREYAQPLDVEALARGVHMSAGHLSREFRRAYGETPYSYLMTRRIERAMALLRRGDLSVTEVCFAVGCSSLGTFSTRFTELVGTTPSEYRRQHADGAPGIPACIEKQVTRPVRNREAPGTGRA